MEYAWETRDGGLFLRIAKPDLDLEATLDCGQCFRFRRLGDGRVTGIALGRRLDLYQDEEGILFHGTPPEEASLWTDYFDLSTDYRSMKKRFSADPVLAEAAAYCGGIRILRQEPFETLISFLISQNNNIPRIKASVEALCQRYGEPLGEGRFAFPSPERLAGVEPEQWKGLGLGYREGYLADCVRRIADGRLRLDAIAAMELEEARAALRTVKGIGVKVAECVLLFGFHRMEAFPIDTWMRKVLAAYYPDGFPQQYAPAGVAQQYLFHYIRTCRRE